MNRETLFESFYTKAEKAIKKMGKQNIKDIYAISMLFPFGKIILKTTPDVLLLQ